MVSLRLVFAIFLSEVVVSMSQQLIWKIQIITIASCVSIINQTQVRLRDWDKLKTVAMIMILTRIWRGKERLTVKLENEFAKCVFVDWEASRLVKDETFSSKSVVSMEKSSILRTMCCIEQQLLLEDHSPSIHDSSVSFKQALLENVREDVLWLWPLLS